MTLEQLWVEWGKGNIPFDLILEAVEDTVKKLASKFYLYYKKSTKFDYDDWESLGNFAVYDSCRKYKADKNTSLKSFITGRILLEYKNTLHRNNTKKKDDSKFSFLSLHSLIEEGNDVYVQDIIPDTYFLGADKQLEIVDTCEYYSNGDDLLKETYFKVYLGYTQSDVARKYNMATRTLNKRVSDNRKRVEKLCLN